MQESPSIPPSTKNAPENESNQEYNQLLDQLHFNTVVESIKGYYSEYLIHLQRISASINCNIRQLYINSVEQTTGPYSKRFEQLLGCAQANDNFFYSILQHLSIFKIQDQEPTSSFQSTDQKKSSQKRYSQEDFNKVIHTLSLCVRDWSSSGIPIRSITHTRIISALEKYVPLGANRPKILVPGAGLGRLVFDLAAKGYSVQGNEWSYLMLLTSNFILNQSKYVDQFTIHPYIHQTSNVLSNSDIIKSFQIPDINPGSLSPNSELSMVAGDFVQIYSGLEHKYKWDSVVTLFFLDTAFNVIDYIETIYHCLPHNGKWVNFGPLTYHWTEVSSPFLENRKSLELSWQDIRTIIEKRGFHFLEFELVNCPYVLNDSSMKKQSYECIYFVLEKRVSETTNHDGVVLPVGAQEPVLLHHSSLEEFDDDEAPKSLDSVKLSNQTSISSSDSVKQVLKS